MHVSCHNRWHLNGLIKDAKMVLRRQLPTGVLSNRSHLNGLIEDAKVVLRRQLPTGVLSIADESRYTRGASQKSAATRVSLQSGYR